MKRLLFAWIFCSITLAAPAQPDTAQPDSTSGYWEGAVVADGAVRTLQLDLTQRDGGAEARLSVPDVGLLELPWPVTLRADTLSFRLFGETAHLLLDRGAAEMRGLVTARDGSQRSIHLKRIPKPVLAPYRTEDVRFRAGDVTLAGTLVLPEGPGPHPAVVFITGRGYGTRWNHYSDAVRLARHGVASFVFDGRGTGESGGDAATVTDLDRYADAHAALDLVLARPDVRAGQVGLVTNSAGAWVGPRVAHESGEVAFLVVNVGPAESLADQQGHVVEYNMRWSGEDFDEDDYRAAFAYQKRLVELSAAGAGWDAFVPLVEAARRAPWAEYVDLPESMDNSELDYYRRRPTFDPVPYLRQTKIPVLAFYGGADYVVPPPANVPKLEQYLSEAGNTDVEIVVLPGADHGLMVRDDGAPWARKAPGYYDTLVAWVLARVAPAAEGADREAVRQAVLDYVEGIYEVDPSRIERSVHPGLAKRGFFRRRGEQAYGETPMTFEQLKHVAATYNREGRVPADAPKAVEVFDVLDQTATAKLTAAWGIDYLHLARYGGVWKIVNVLWQSPPPVE